MFFHKQQYNNPKIQNTNWTYSLSGSPSVITKSGTIITPLSGNYMASLPAGSSVTYSCPTVMSSSDWTVEFAYRLPDPGSSGTGSIEVMTVGSGTNAFTTAFQNTSTTDYTRIRVNGVAVGTSTQWFASFWNRIVIQSGGGWWINGQPQASPPTLTWPTTTPGAAVTLTSTTTEILFDAFRISNVARYTPGVTIYQTFPLLYDNNCWFYTDFPGGWQANNGLI